MSLFQVFECVEAALTKCNVLDRYGEPMKGLEAIGQVSSYDPKAWQTLEDALERGEVTPEGYQAQALDLIAAFCRLRNRSAIEKRLTQLSVEQRRLGITRPPGACV